MYPKTKYYDDVIARQHPWFRNRKRPPDIRMIEKEWKQGIEQGLREGKLLWRMPSVELLARRKRRHRPRARKSLASVVIQRGEGLSD